jgi:hypothetical protein
MSRHRLSARIARLERAPIFYIGRDLASDIARHFYLLLRRFKGGLTPLEALEEKKLREHLARQPQDPALKDQDKTTKG